MTDCYSIEYVCLTCGATYRQSGFPTTTCIVTTMYCHKCGHQMVVPGCL